jgi:hypothetical protein
VIATPPKGTELIPSYGPYVTGRPYVTSHE